MESYVKNASVNVVVVECDLSKVDTLSGGNVDLGIYLLISFHFLHWKRDKIDGFCDTLIKDGKTGDFLWEEYEERRRKHPVKGQYIFVDLLLELEGEEASK